MPGPPPVLGVFDSGIGGLSVLEAITAALPGIDTVFVADSGHVPYGPKPPEAIQARSQTLVRFLVERGAAAVVIACNTATAAAAEYVRARFDLPIVGMEPAIKPARAATQAGVVGVLATSGTLASARFAALLDRFADDIRVVDRPAPDLVLAVEAGELDGPRTRAAVDAHIGALRSEGADVVVLGCTHFVFLRPLIEASAGPGMAIIDTGAAVARRLATLLAERGVEIGRGGRTEYWTTGDAGRSAAVIGSVLGRDVEVRRTPDEFA